MRKRRKNVKKKKNVRNKLVQKRSNIRTNNTKKSILEK